MTFSPSGSSPQSMQLRFLCVNLPRLPVFTSLCLFSGSNSLCGFLFLAILWFIIFVSALAWVARQFPGYSFMGTFVKFSTVTECVSIHFHNILKSSIQIQDKVLIFVSVKAESTIEAKQVLTGQVTKILPNQGLLVRLPMYKCGLVALTDLRDSYVENPLESFKEMQLVRWVIYSSITCCVCWWWIRF